jgi:DNA-directed RNA polymerase specialized sigma24 family protein
MHAQEVRRLVMQFVSDPAEVDDLVDEILAECVSTFAKSDQSQTPADWVRRVASRVLARRWHRRGIDY